MHQSKTYFFKSVFPSTTYIRRILCNIKNIFYLLMVIGQKSPWQLCWVMWIICQNVWSICIFSSTLKFQQVLQTWIGSKLHFYPNLTWLQHECKQWSLPKTCSNLEKVTQIRTQLVCTVNIYSNFKNKVLYITDVKTLASTGS